MYVHIWHYIFDFQPAANHTTSEFELHRYNASVQNVDFQVPKHQNVDFQIANRQNVDLQIADNQMKKYVNQT
jgi:hypothetical protein